MASVNNGSGNDHMYEMLNINSEHTSRHIYSGPSTSAHSTQAHMANPNTGVGEDYANTNAQTNRTPIYINEEAYSSAETSQRVRTANDNDGAIVEKLNALNTHKGKASNTHERSASNTQKGKTKNRKKTVCILTIILILIVLTAASAILGVFLMPKPQVQSSNIRLSNSTRQDHSNGRLEVFHNNTWGTICEHNFDNNAATVVCRQLGFTGNLFVSRDKAAYGAGTGTIWLDDVTCIGNETDLFTCAHNPWGENDCEHDEDVGVDCNPNVDAFVNLRLVNGSNGNQGRVEVQHYGMWGTVCDDGWDEHAAMVTCKQILHRTDSSGLTAIPLPGAIFGSGTVIIWLDDVKCTGLEAGIGACTHKPWGDSDCQHSKDTGVMCLENSGPSNVTLQLTGGLFYGRVEIRVYDMWGTICRDGFGVKEATVICRMLGHHSGGTVLLRGSYGTGSGPIWLDDVVCAGNETRIQDCVHRSLGNNNCGHDKDVAVLCHSLQAIPLPGAIFGSGTVIIWLDDVKCTGLEAGIGACTHKPWGDSDCQHSKDTGVMCLENSGPSNVTLQLTGGLFYGRVEIRVYDMWGTICRDGFGVKEATVICRMLGHHSGGTVLLRGSYGTGSGPIWLDDVVCAGNETRIQDCVHRSWGNNNCGHDKDVAVLCHSLQGPPNVTVQLAGGLSMYHGRVEIRVYDMWGTICDDGFGDNEATVICRMLGHHSGGTVLTSGSYGGGSGEIWLDDVKCAGNETRIQDCVHRPWGSTNCGHYEDVAVLCHSVQDWWGCYIGLNDIQQDGNYSWFGTKRLLSQTRYKHWARDQPDNMYGNEDCVVLGIAGYWYDVSCTAGRGYICEIRD